jgi:hypothetical protein
MIVHALVSGTVLNVIIIIIIIIMVSSCEYDNEQSGSIKGEEFLD